MIMVMGIIFFLSNQPGDTIILPDVPDIDKLLHSLIYGVLAAATLYAVPEKRRRNQPIRTGISVILFCLAYGLSDEFHQSFIPGRCSSIWDLGADFLGAVMVVSVWLYRKSSGLRVPRCGFRI